MSPAISVIIPVYKAERYIRRCIDSLLAQTFTDFELLLVDDGSPDNSGRICREYAENDARVRVFRKENGGVSSARQYGLDNARGEYIIHADPDDWVEPDMLERLYAKACEADADMVICDFWRHDKQDKAVYCSQNAAGLTSGEVFRLLLAQQLHGSLWNKAIRATCYRKYDIRIPENMVLWEDLFVCCALLMHPLRVTYLNQAFYHYDCYSNANSLVRSASLRQLQSQVYFVDWFAARLDQSDYAEEFFRLKAITKERALYTQDFPAGDFMALYADIHEEYLHRYGRCKVLKPNKICTAMAIRGHVRVARMLYRSYVVLRNLFKSL